MAFHSDTVTGARAVMASLHEILTNSSLLKAKSPSQVWQSLRHIPDNLKSVTHNFLGENRDARNIFNHEEGFYPQQEGIKFDAYMNNPTWMVIELYEAFAVKKMSFTFNSQGDDRYYLMSFDLLGSNDGNNFTPIQTITLDLANVMGYSEFAINNNTSYKFYKFNNIKSNSNSLVTKGWKMLDAQGVNRSNSTYLFIVKGPGLANQDEIFVGYMHFKDSKSGENGFFIYGMTGYSATEPLLKQPGVCPRYVPSVPLWDGPTKYVISATGRRIFGTFKVSSNFNSFYAGFLLPYATPLQYPYPLFVGGQHCAYSKVKFSETGDYTMNYIRGSWGTSWGNGQGYASSGYVLDPAGTWQNICRWGESFYTLPIRLQSEPSNFKYENVGGGYVLEPVVVCRGNYLGSPAMLGELDGIQFVSGHGLAADSDGNINGQRWMIFQDGYRNGINDFHVMKVE